ncbi:hypothetical protein BJF79_31140 [Actinomadura sp. CNU-125]|nr:hypothetical protein BJF79_31140 [Actinomadura sp. CNU-125]
MRLFAAAATGDADARDAVVRIAGTPDHRLAGLARETVAGWWCDGRDPGMRAAVLATGAVSVLLPDRLLTLALLNRLDEWAAHDAQWAPELLADADPDVRERAAARCRDATGPMLAALWKADTGPKTPLRTVLLENSEPPPAPVLDRLWQQWLRSPDPKTGDALLRWRRPATGGWHASLTAVAVADDADVLREPAHREALLSAMLLDRNPVHDIAVKRFTALNARVLVDELCARALTDPAAERFCRDHDVVPADPVRRSLFYLVTGRPAQHRAVDPDGGLLALAYAAAPADLRARVREAMLTAGELDLVRVIAGNDRVPDMSAEETSYLAEQLAERREWADLWALLQDLPLAASVRLVRLFDRWTPRAADQRRLFALLREADPDTVAACTERLSHDPLPAVPQATYLFQGRVNDISFAPDGPFLAVAGITKAVGVFDLRTAELVERYDGFGASVGSVLHLGNGALIAGEHPNQGQPQCRLVRCEGGARRVLHTANGAADCLTLTGDGAFAAGTRDGELLFGDPKGRVRARTVASFGLGRAQWPRQLAAHRPTGRLALLGRSVHLVDPATGDARRVHARTTARVAFADADTLVCAEHDGTLTRVPLEDGPRHTAKVPGFAGMGVLPRTGQVIVADGPGDLHLFGGELLDDAGVHTPPRHGGASGLTVSPDGDFLALGHRDGTIDLFDLRPMELPALARCPMASFVPRHLDLVAAACAAPALDEPARRTLELLRACLEHRFRFDVEVGESVALAGGEHDIGL